MTASWCLRCGRYHWAFPDCDLPLKRCLHERCEGHDECQVVRAERT